MKNMTKLSHTEFIDTLLQAEPIDNFPSTKTETMFLKSCELTSWHRTYGPCDFSVKINIAIRMIGTPCFKKKKLQELNIQFEEKTYIWGFRYKNIGNLFLYMSQKGTSLEITPECEPYLADILDTLTDALQNN